MPPRKSRKSAAALTGSAAVGSDSTSRMTDEMSALSEFLSTLTAEIDGACVDWVNGGEDSVKRILDQQVEKVVRHAATTDAAQEENSIPEIGLSKSLSVLLSHANLSPERIATVYQAILGDREGDARTDAAVALGEVLVELVEALEDEVAHLTVLKKDAGGRKEVRTPPTGAPSAQGMEVDDAVGREPVISSAKKGMEVIKLLLQSQNLPAFLPNILLSPNRLLSIGLHPMPRHAPGSFDKEVNKRTTQLFYKLTKFNLLREASEGFSRLLVLLLSTEVLPSNAVAQLEDDETRSARAQAVWDKIMSLIAYFDLSHPRVLDLLLEIAHRNVAEHWRFWLELLKCSPWGSTARSSKGKERMWDDSVEGVEGALSGSGDRVLAQVLGVKFDFSKAPLQDDDSMGLAQLTALLLKHGYIAFADILPFLSPNDEEMEALRKEWLASASKASATRNALTDAVLVDDSAPSGSSPSGRKTEDAKPAAKYLSQKVDLLQALLSIGHMPPALYLLNKAPWLAQYSPPIADLIMRIVDINVEPLYVQHQREWEGAIQGEERLAEAEDDLELEQPANHYRSRVASLDRRVVKSMLYPLPLDTDVTKFEFFYPDWADGLQRWETVDDIRRLGLKWLALVRGSASRRIETIVRICRLGQLHHARLKKEKEEPLGRMPQSRADKRAVELTDAEVQPWLEIIRVSLLPALSSSSVTAAFDLEVWRMLTHLPYATRYRLYGEWRDSTAASSQGMNKNPCPTSAVAAASATRSIKQALSRVTSDGANAAAKIATAQDKKSVDRGPARSLAKVSHANPCQLWTAAVNQVKNYPNIGEAIVDAGKYMTEISFDVASFTLVDTLADDRVNKLNENGTGPAAWLINLATFAADLNRRYHTMNLESLLQAIMNRLKRRESLDLTVLSVLLDKMTGETRIDNNSMTAAQLACYAGGRELVKEAFDVTNILIHKTNQAGDGVIVRMPPVDKARMVKKSYPRLLTALRDTGMMMPIWVALGQTALDTADRMAHTPIKAISTMLDSCEELFAHYGDIVQNNCTDAEIIAGTPDLEALVNDFGLDIPQAFTILRPRMAAERRQAVAAVGDADDVVEMSGGVWQSAMRQARDLLSDTDNEIMTSPFFVTFWQLSMPDIACSQKSYKAAMDAIETLVKQLQSNSWQGEKPSKKDPEIRRLRERKNVLQKEMEEQTKAVEVRRKQLSEESKTWFSDAITRSHQNKKLADQIHQHCLYPRALQSPKEALFVPKFIRLLHDVGTPRFSTFYTYSNFFAAGLAAKIFACTENEARNLGRCLAAIMAQLDPWHADEKVYKREALGIIDAPVKKEKEVKGGDIDMNGGSANGTDGESKTQSPLPGMTVWLRTREEWSHMTWISFKGFYARNIHTALKDALLSCWNETEYMHIQNAITVALEVLPSFPAIVDHGNEIEAAIKAVTARTGHEEVTSDLKLQCHSYSSRLRNRQKTKPLVPASAFSTIKSRQAPASAANAGIDKPSATPIKDSGTTSSAEKAVRASEPAKSAPTAALNAQQTNATPNGTSALDLQASLRAKLEESRNAKTIASRTSNTLTEVSSSLNGRSLSADEAANKDQKPVVPPSGPRSSVPGTAAGGSSRDRQASPAGPAKKDTPTGPSGKPSMGPPATDKPLTVSEQRAAEDARRFAALSKSTTGSSSADIAPAKGGSTPVRAPTAPRGSVGPSTPDIKPQTAAPAADSAASSRRPSPDRTARKRSRSVESRMSERSRRDRKEERPRDREREKERDRDRDRERDRDRSKRDGERNRDRDRNLDDARTNDARSRTPSVRGDEDRHRGTELLPSNGNDRRRSLRADPRDDKGGRDDKDRRERDRRSGDKQDDREREREREAGGRRRDDDRATRASSRRDELEPPHDGRDRRDERDRPRDRDERDKDKNRPDRRDEIPRERRGEVPRDRRDERDHTVASFSGRNDDNRRDEDRRGSVRESAAKRELLPDRSPIASSRQRDPAPSTSVKDDRAAKDVRARSPSTVDRSTPLRSERMQTRESTPLAARISGAAVTSDAAKGKIEAVGKVEAVVTPARPHGLPTRPEASSAARNDRDRPNDKDQERSRQSPLANSSLPDRPRPSDNAQAPASRSLADRMGLGRGDTPKSRSDDPRNRDDVRERGARDDRDGGRRGGGRDDRRDRDARDRRDDRDREREGGRDRARDRDGGRQSGNGERRRDEEDRDRDRKRPHDDVSNSAPTPLPDAPLEKRPRTEDRGRGDSGRGDQRVRIDRNRARRDGPGRSLLDAALKDSNPGGR